MNLLTNCRPNLFRQGSLVLSLARASPSRAITTPTTQQKNKKSFTQEDFNKVNAARFKDKEMQYVLDNPDPFSIIKRFCKALTVGFIAATLCSIGYGAYDDGYRKTLRTSYPLAAAVLDMVKAKEEEVVVSQDISKEEASIFREGLKDRYKA